MTRRQYRALGIHWSVLDQARRPRNLRAEWFAVFDLLTRDRRCHGHTEVYDALWTCLKSLT